MTCRPSGGGQWSCGQWSRDPVVGSVWSVVCGQWSVVLWSFVDISLSGALVEHTERDPTGEV